jgi:outer membrane protein assembly factor BamB
VSGDYLYSCQINGILSCYEAKTGKVVYQERLGTGRTGFTASPVLADGKLYFTSEEGEVYVVQAGPEFKVLATNSMGEVCMATPAVSEGTLFFRTRGHLVAIGGTAKK